MLTALALASLPVPPPPVFEISEVLVTPLAGGQVVELTNVSPAVADTATVQMVVGSTFQNLPSAAVAPGAFVRVHVGALGVDTATDLFAPALSPLLAPAGSVALFDAVAGGIPPGFFGDATKVRDFVQWGAPHQPHADVAEEGLTWFWPDTFAPAPGPGESLAWDGSGKLATSWFRDVSPTLGGANVQPTAGLGYHGFQCTPAAAGPMLQASSPPALGNRDFEVELWTQSVGMPGWMFAGLSTAAVPIFGGACTFLVGQVFTHVPFTVSPEGFATFPVPVAEDPSLIGVRLVAQAAVVNGFGLGAFSPPIDLSAALVIDF